MLGISFFIDAITQSNTVVVISLIIGYLFFSFNGIVSYSACIDISGDRAGTVAGIMNFFGQIGAFFLAIVFGKIVDFTHNFNSPLYVLAIVLFTGCLLWFAVDPGKPLIVESEHHLKTLNNDL